MGIAYKYYFNFGITSALIVPFVRVYTHGVSDTNYIQPLFAILLVVANVTLFEVTI